MIKIKIIVCIKQVPATTEVKIDPQTNTLIREGIENIINPFDSYAIEEAVRIKERFVAEQTFSEEEIETIAMTMGPPQAEHILRDAISVGIDKAILLSDRAFAGSDTLATSSTLAAAAKKIKGYKIILFGKQTLDGDTAQVGPELAHYLKMPFVGYVSSILEIDRQAVVLKRLMDDRYETFRLRFPIAMSVTKDINIPRVQSLRGKMKAKKAEIAVWKKEDIEMAEEELGLLGSTTRVIKIFTSKIEKDTEVFEGSTEEKIEKLYSKLKSLNIV